MATDLRSTPETGPETHGAESFDAWADRVLSGGELTRQEAAQILASDDDDLLS